MKQLFSALILAAFIVISCDKDSQTGETYSDMQITEFVYSEIPAAGGTIAPKITYKYKATTAAGKVEERTTGAATMFTGDNSNFSVDKENGKITASANMSVEPISFTIELVVSKESLSAHKTITVIQAGAKEEIIDTKTVQLPIVLDPHTCVYPAGYDPENKTYLFDTTKEYEYTTTRTDGKTDRDYMDQINPKSGIVGVGAKIGVTSEYVSAAGVEIPVSGGDIVNINTYRSGKVDTTVVAKAVYSVSTNYTFQKERYVEDNTTKYTSDEETERPKSSISNNVWKINKIGYGIYYGISHTITATANNQIQELTINQQTNYVIEDNYGVGAKNQYLVFKNHEFYTQRDNWPNFEDYPVGCSSPKWAKDEYGDYVALEDTKDLHPDGNRYIDFYFHVDYDRMMRGNKYISGARNNDFLIQNHNMRNLLRGGITVVATADVKLKDGSTKTVTHTSQWIQPEDSGEWNDVEYKGRGKLSSFTIYLPLVENAAEDFTWSLTFSINLTDKHSIYGCNLKERSNFFSYNWSFKDYIFKDCLYTVNEYREAKKISGIFAGSVYNDKNQGDIIDGVEQ